MTNLIQPPEVVSAPERGHASISAFDVTISTDTYYDDNGEAYTVVAVWPHDKAVVLVDDADVYRNGEFV